MHASSDRNFVFQSNDYEMHISLICCSRPTSLSANHRDLSTGLLRLSDMEVCSFRLANKFIHILLYFSRYINLHPMI